jgi:hypothetical protein
MTQGKAKAAIVPQGKGKATAVQPVTITQGKGKTAAALPVTTTQGKGKAAAAPDKSVVASLPAAARALPVTLSLQLVMSPRVPVPMQVPAPGVTAVGDAANGAGYAGQLAGIACAAQTAAVRCPLQLPPCRPCRFMPAGSGRTYLPLGQLICTLLATVRHPAPAGCGVAERGELAGFDNSINFQTALCWPPSGIRLRQGVGRRREGSLPASTTPSSALCGPPSGIRPGVGRQRAGARWLRQLHHLHSAGHRPVSGCGRVWGGSAWGARWLRQPHHLHSAGIRLRPGVGRRREGSSPSSTTPSSALCGPPSGIRFQHPAPAVLLAAVRHPAPAVLEAVLPVVGSTPLSPHF